MYYTDIPPRQAITEIISLLFQSVFTHCIVQTPLKSYYIFTATAFLEKWPQYAETYLWGQIVPNQNFNNKFPEFELSGILQFFTDRPMFI